MQQHGRVRENWFDVPPHVKNRMFEVARDLRRDSTVGERVLWEALRGRRLDGRKFRRQQPLGPFVVDFFCAAERLVVELDGSVHDSQQDLDAERQALIESTGLRFVRLSNDLVRTDLEAALRAISGVWAAQTPPLRLSERGSGGEVR